MRIVSTLRMTRFLTVMMLALALGGLAIAAFPSGAAAHLSGPTQPNCVPEMGSMVICPTVIATLEDDVRESVYEQSCNLGWSHRKATQDVTVVDVYRQEQVHVDRWYWSTFGSWTFSGSSDYTRFTFLERTVVEGECRPVTGRPPQ